MQISNVRKCFFIEQFLLPQINTDNPHQKPLPMIDQVQQSQHSHPQLQQHPQLVQLVCLHLRLVRQVCLHLRLVRQVCLHLHLVHLHLRLVQQVRLRLHLVCLQLCLVGQVHLRLLWFVNIFFSLIFHFRIRALHIKMFWGGCKILTLKTCP